MNENGFGYIIVFKEISMFKKISFIFLSLFLVFFMSCEDEIDPAAVAAGEEIAAEVAGIAMQMGIQVDPEIMEEEGLSRTTAPSFTHDNMDGEPTGLTFSGSYTSVESDTNYDVSITLTMNFDDVLSDDEVWTMNGDIVSNLEMVLDKPTTYISMEGTVTGDLTASDGSSEYTFDLALNLSVEQTGEKTFSCTVSGTVTSGSNEITVDETFTYTQMLS
jgi:hypothetical protein